MFEPQDHPNDFQYPGGPPMPPYDNAGWTLAYQMGVQFDRMLDAFDGPFARIEGFATPPPGTLANLDGAAGFLLDHRVNDVVILTNRLLARAQPVYWLTRPLAVGGGRTRRHGLRPRDTRQPSPAAARSGAARLAGRRHRHGAPR